MANVEDIVQSLLNEYDNSIGARQVNLAEAIEVTDQLIDALKERLQALHDDEKAADANDEDAD
jgi:hypothetical protein